MAKRFRSSAWAKSFQRSVAKITRTALRAGTRALVKAAKPVVEASIPKVAKPARPARKPAGSGAWEAGIAVVGVSSRRFRLYVPAGLALVGNSTVRAAVATSLAARLVPGVVKGVSPGATLQPSRSPRPALLVMLHGCQQDATALAASTRMNLIAAREGFMVLYPEQDRMAHGHGCWNWYETRNGRAQAEAAMIVAAVDQLVSLGRVDPARIAIAGMSAGAGMAALAAVRYPQRFKAVAMHSGIAPGAASSTASALSAMHGRRKPDIALPADGAALPPLLVIQGGADLVVMPSNAVDAAEAWAAALDAKPVVPRIVQRGKRHSMRVIDYKSRGRVVVSLCEIAGLGHAWSGGAADRPFSDASGPDASKLIWAFASRQFQSIV